MVLWSVGNGAAAGGGALLYMSIVGCLDALAEAGEKFSSSASSAPPMPPIPRLNRPPFMSDSPTDPTFGLEEIPTGPAGYQDKTRPVSTNTVAAAERAIASRKKNE